jgi:hypothetical protein
MEKQRNPGLWIAAAAMAAVLVMLVAMPGKKDAPPPTPAPASIKSTAQAEAESALKPTPIPGPQPQPADSIASTPSTPPSTPSITPATKPPAIDPGDAPPPVPPKTATPADRENTFRVLENVQFALRDFRSALGENPVGTNAEITSSLLGSNLKQVKIPLPDGATLNGAGELCDPWGTPFFFHQQSGTKMEIRSAGFDRKLYTADDVVM